MLKLTQLDGQRATDSWNETALNMVQQPDLGLNPAFYTFYLHQPGMSPYYILLRSNNRTDGLLPLVGIGKKYCSLPHLSYGGIYWSDENGDRPRHPENILLHIISKLMQSGLPPGFYACELNDLTEENVHPSPDIEIRSEKPWFGINEAEKAIHQVVLGKTYEDFENDLSSSVKRKIARAQKNGIHVKKGGVDLVPDFSRVYNRNIHRIGSPTLGKGFFNQLASQEDLNAEVFVAYLDGKPVGGSFSMNYGGYYENNWFATLDRYNKLYTSYLLHSEMVKSAIDKKAKIYSLGRSTLDSGVYRYKLQYPVREIPVYFSRSRKPRINLKRQKWISSAWRFIPSALADNLGPYFAKKMF